MQTAGAPLVAEFLIGGITRADVQQLTFEAQEAFLFHRDPSCWIYDGVTLNPMTEPAGNQNR